MSATNGNGVILLPSQLPSSHGLTAAQREEERLALVAHVEVLTAQVNEVTRACGALIQAQRQNEAALSGLATFDREQDRRFDAFEELLGHAARRIDAIERGAAILSAWIKRPFWERVRARLGL